MKNNKVQEIVNIIDKSFEKSIQCEDIAKKLIKKYSEEGLSEIFSDLFKQPDFGVIDVCCYINKRFRFLNTKQIINIMLKYHIDPSFISHASIAICERINEFEDLELMLKFYKSSNKYDSIAAAGVSYSIIHPGIINKEIYLKLINWIEKEYLNIYFDWHDGYVKLEIFSLIKRYEWFDVNPKKEFSDFINSKLNVAQNGYFPHEHKFSYKTEWVFRKVRRFFTNLFS